MLESITFSSQSASISRSPNNRWGFHGPFEEGLSGAGIDSTLRFACEHLGFVDVIRIVDVEFAPDQVEGEMLQFTVGRIE